MYAQGRLSNVPVDDKTPEEIFDIWAESDQLIKFGNSVAKKFTTLFYQTPAVPEDDIKQIYLIALWKCALNHDNGKGNYFENSLSRHIFWEIKDYQSRFRRLNKVKLQDAYRSGFVKTKTETKIDLSEYFSGEDLKLMRLYIDYGATLQELGKVYGISHEAARLRINKVITKVVGCI